MRRLIFGSHWLPAPFSVTGPESYLLATRLGLGLAQIRIFTLPRISSAEVWWPCSPTVPPVRAGLMMYAQNRQFSPRLRAFSDWLAHQFRKDEG
jgi:DNA-binding transcriptional LysR family regulator